MISDIGYALFFGKPLVLWLGTLAGAAFISAALVMILNFYTKVRIPARWHHYLAFIGLAVMIIHAILAIAIYI